MILLMSEHAVFDRIADFRFLRLLGSGTFAHTYLAERGGERFAVKVFHDLPAAGEPRERFRREVASLRIEHANLAEYVESGIAECGGREAAYIAMRYLPGQSLREHLNAGAGALPVAQAVPIAQGICSGLHVLHEHGTVHRDVKPANIYLPAAGGVVILDFGLARVRDLTTITARGAFVGSLAYCAPEQIRGEADIHSDLYALGAVLFEMLTGRRPFTASNELELIERIMREEPEPAGVLTPSVSAWLERLVGDLLAKEPLQRPRSAKAVLATLSAPPGSAARAVRPPYERSSAPVLALRAVGPGSARAILDAAMRGSSPDIAIAPVTQQAALEELHRARALTSTPLAVDTLIARTGIGGFGAVAALRGRSYMPTGGEPHTPRSLRSSGESERVARGDIAEQLNDGASLLRAPAFPIDGPESPWLRRNPRLLEISLAARDALAPELALYAQLPCTIDALAHREHRLSIVNRYARGEPDGCWLSIAGLDGGAPEQLAGALDLALMIQHLGAPCVWTLPGTIAEFAWSLGVAGVEVTLGRVGAFRLPVSGQVIRNADRAPRFEFPSIMTSLSAGHAADALATGVLAECDCPCPSCAVAASVAERLLNADAHNLWVWSSLRDELARLDDTQRVERYRFRLTEAGETLRDARRATAALRSLRHLQLARQTLTLVLAERVLDTPARLRRAG